MKKFVIVLLLVTIVLLVAGCESKKAKQKEDTWLKLSYISEELDSMMDDCMSAYKSENYSFMQDELWNQQERLESIKKTIDILVDRYADRD